MSGEGERQNGKRESEPECHPKLDREKEGKEEKRKEERERPSERKRENERAKARERGTL